MGKMPLGPTAVLAVGCALVVLGCGPAGKPTGTVAGEVTYKGETIRDGDITLHSRSTGVAATAKLQDGKFTFAQPIEAGEYTVYITPPRPEPTDPKKGPPPVIQSNIPMKVRDLTTSDLKTTVKTGSNTLKIDILD